MNCAPFQVLRSQQRKPLFPSVRACRALRDHETHPECCCRAYPNRGFYVVGACGHAHAWDLHRVDADAVAARLNEMATREGEGKRVPTTPSSGESAGRGVPADRPLSPEAADPPAGAPIEDPQQATFMDFVGRGAAAQAAVDRALQADDGGRADS